MSNCLNGRRWLRLRYSRLSRVLRCRRLSATFLPGGYAAGYYGYKWAEVLAADAFSLFKEKGIFNPEVAEAFRREILSKGGHEHPMTLYVNFRGHKPETKALIEKMGLEK